MTPSMCVWLHQPAGSEKDPGVTGGSLGLQGDGQQLLPESPGSGDRREKVTLWVSVLWDLQLFPPQKCTARAAWHRSALQLLVRGQRGDGVCRAHKQQTWARKRGWQSMQPALPGKHSQPRESHSLTNTDGFSGCC